MIRTRLDNLPPLAKRSGVNSKFGLKHFLAGFALCAVFYLVSFHGIEHFRVRKGPWQITFTADAGAPAIAINQPKLGIRNVKLTFPGATATNVMETIAFDTARPVPFDVPGGQCVFLDTISLPGNVTLQIRGHQIQLLPRTLTIDHREQPWKSDAVFPLPAKTQKPNSTGDYVGNSVNS